MLEARLQQAREAVWGPMSTRVRQSKALRNPAITGYRAIARTVLVASPPKVFANSIPKAGTHLLTQLLSGVPSMWFSGVHVIDKDFRPDLHVRNDGLGEFDAPRFARTMRGVRNGQFLTAHLGAFPGVSDILEVQGFSPILMIRDPRDIAVSMAFYFAKNPRLHMHRRFADMASDGDRLMAAITGLPAADGNPPVPSMGERLEKYDLWLKDGRNLLIRFEELVGSGGGGSDEVQLDAVRRILTHINRDAGEQRARDLARATFATHAATFRRGAIGDWSNHFAPEHQAAFDEVAPGALARFGYQ